MNFFKNIGVTKNILNNLPRNPKQTTYGAADLTNVIKYIFRSILKPKVHILQPLYGSELWR